VALRAPGSQELFDFARQLARSRLGFGIRRVSRCRRFSPNQSGDRQPQQEHQQKREQEIQVGSVTLHIHGRNDG